MKKFSGYAVPRSQLFTLNNGVMVIQWDENQVQELLTGEYREFDHWRDYGHGVTDYDLKQMKAAGRVEHFNRNFVWLYALPESNRFAVKREAGKHERTRVYYLCTIFPKSQAENVATTLQALNLADRLQIRVREDLVILVGGDGQPFETMAEAEEMQEIAFMRGQAYFHELTIGFLEIVPKAHPILLPEDPTDLNLDDLIASQNDTSLTEGRRVVLALAEPEEHAAFSDLFDALAMEVLHATNSTEALELLEDYPPDLLVMDMQLPDLHGWQLLSKLKEIETLRDVPIILIIDEPTLGTTVARVDYITRPVSIARLRHTVWKLLHEKQNIPSTGARPMGGTENSAKS